jgi:hypothetical protein
MAKRMKAYVIAPDSENELEASGIRSKQASFVGERETAKVPRVDLDRLLEEERERLRAEEQEREALEQSGETMVMAPVSEQPESQETTVKMQAPEVPLDTPSPLGSDFPPPVPELTAVMKFTPVPIPPPPLPPFEAMREARDEARKTKRIVVAIWALALTVVASLGYVVASQG